MTQLLPGKEKVATATRSGWMSKDDYTLLHGIPAITSVAAPLTLTGGVLALAWPRNRLAFAASADVWSATAFAAGTYNDACANQAFTINSVAAELLITLRLNALVQANAAGIPQAIVRLNFDTGARLEYISALAGTNTGAAWFAAGGGALRVSGIAAGVHNVKVQVATNVAAFVYLRAASAPTTEFLNLEITEMTP